MVKNYFVVFFFGCGGNNFVAYLQSNLLAFENRPRSSFPFLLFENRGRDFCFRNGSSQSGF